jgi:hypothetical protein
LALTADERSERSLLGRIGAYGKWQQCDDPTAATAPARQAFLERFLDEVDPERKLPVAERERKAEYARKRYFTKLALASARSRRRAKKSVNTTDDGAPPIKSMHATNGRPHQTAAVNTDPGGTSSDVCC